MPTTFLDRCLKWWARFRLRSLSYSGQVALSTYGLAANQNVPMGKKWRYVLYIYGAGALIMEAILILDAYGNGGFQRQHSVTDLIILAPQYLATAALWPLLIVILTLVYFGVLPAGIWDL